MGTILMEMLKMWNVTDGHTNVGQTMVNRPRHKLITIEDLQDGCCDGHCGYRNKMVLAILNLYVVPMPPTKFWLNLTYPVPLGNRSGLKIFKMATMGAILDTRAQLFKTNDVVS